jgi:SAM-dependent methyltransferase
MDKSPNQPDPTLVYDLFSGVWKPHLIRIALQLDILTPLASGAASTEVVAQYCQCDRFGAKALLDYLASLKVIERHADNTYSLTSTADTFLVRGRKSYVGDLILHYTDEAFFESVLQSLRSGKPIPLVEDFAQDAWLESYSEWRIQYSREMWQTAGITPDQFLDIEVLDIACGCAIKSLILAQASPKVRITCLDAPDVLVVARDLVERMQVTSQVSFMPADLLEADFGEGQFDAVLLGQISHYLTESQNKDLFRRIYAALSPNGTFLIDCPMTTDQPSENASFLTLVLWANSDGMAYPFETYQVWLKDTGFRQIKQLSERWLAATKS